MVVNRVHIRIRLLVACFLFFSVYGQTNGPYFMVTFPAVIESGSNAKLCVSFLNPNETLQMNIYLVDGNKNRTLLQTTVEKDIHQCSHFEDNYQNRIGQWTNVSSGLILQLAHELNAEAPQGHYQIIADTGNKMIRHGFKVEKHVLPKFEVIVNAPEEHSVGNEELKLEVCGKYTYGQPVPGQAVVQVCRNFRHHYYDAPKISPCLSETVEMGQNGCAFLTINVSNFINTVFENEFLDNLDVTITLTEEGTDLSLVKSHKIKLSFQIGKVEILEAPNNFERGKVIEGRASVYSTETYLEYKRKFFAKAEKSIHLLEPATPYSPVYSELTIKSSEEPFKCGAEIPITINYYIVGETAESFSMDLIYTVLSRGTIVHLGHEKVEVESSTDDRKGEFSFKLSVAAEFSPAVQVVVYSVLPSENVIAANKNFDIEKCFKHKVSLQFSPTKAVPGEKNTLELTAHPGSLCGLSAVDQSVFILESGDRLNIDKIFKMLPVTSTTDYPYEVVDDQECLHVRPRRDILNDHVYDALKGVGLKMATNLPVRQPNCLMYKGMQFHRVHYRSNAYPVALALGRYSPEDGYIETVRKFFPETWIWQLYEVGDSGSVELPVTVPDTITTWETETFCVSSVGLGLAPPVMLTVFQPFFLELSLPYSIIRGEVFELKATVFNYLSKCIMVKVTPAPSSDYTLKPSSDGENLSCLCANGRKTFIWTLTPTVLGVLNVTVSAEADQSQTVCDNEIVSVPERGRIDTVTRSLIVQPEGTEKTKSQSWLLCPQGSSVSEELELTLPEDVIEGSARASVSVLGDILGRALKNLDGLLRMPYGCGEQNIALLAPNIYILQYLENTEQLTTAIRERATGYLKSGYQRQLNYKHFSGAYSTFGTGEENTWLTAFVMRTFGKAQRYVYIDPEIIKSAKTWLIGMQRPDGCFRQQGRLFNNRMKNAVVSKGLRCLNSSLGNLTNTYTTALLAYTFSLAGESEVREQLLKDLDSAAIIGDGRLHWSQSALDDSDSLSVEISSYVLLAVLTTGELTAADLGYANKIVSWLVKQQNPYGGFSSTQDTVVALQALALYSTKVFSSDGSSTVTVKSADENSHNFDVNQNNKLLFQERSLLHIPGKYTIDVKGSTCVSVQTTLFYNIPIPSESSTLSITATTDGNCTKSFGHILAINFSVNRTTDFLLLRVFFYPLVYKVLTLTLYEAKNQQAEGSKKFGVNVDETEGAPQIAGESVQDIQVEVKGESFKMTEKRKVMFRSYDTLFFIQTDRPIYNPGQTGLILQLSHELNAEAPQGHYQIIADTGNKLIRQNFKVEKHDVSMVKSKIIKLSFQIGQVKLTDIPKNFERGKVIEGKIKVSTFSGTPISNKTVYLLEGKQRPQKLLLNLTTDSNGLADFSIASPEQPTTEITLLASIYPEQKHHGYKIPFFSNADARIHLLQPATPHSPLFSELTIESSDEPFMCGAKSQITIKYYIVGETAESFSIDLTYMVLSKGAIVHHGHEKIEVEESADVRRGETSFKLPVVVEFAPVVQVVVYSVLPSKNVFAASKNFAVEKCFRNQVSLQFSPTNAVPSEKNTLKISAYPGSLCGLSAVDQSVFILEAGDRLNSDKIFKLLPVTSVSGYPYMVEDYLDCLHVRPKRDVQFDDVYNKLKSVGLKMATNLAVRRPQCLMFKNLRYFLGDSHGYYMSMAYDLLDSDPVPQSYNIGAPEPIITVRKFFPETWIWQLVEVGDSGSIQLPVTVPDTITTWETEAFCVSSVGLGLAPPVQLTVFQPFFLELSLPYSIIRGEVFELRATVFSYLSKCIMVKVTPATSSEYTLKPSSDDEYSSCLCANGRKTFKWTLIPAVLGSSVSEELELTLPEDVIKGSARASVSVLGDILGRALKNLDGLLKMPYGCGEQNIALLAPNIYILRYLENTEQLTTEVRERATGFLKSGYQRQLNYKHLNGAYSTFGNGEENTWLTAFVLRTFGKAQRYIYTDPEIINSAKNWLISMQRPDGCFTQQGKLFHNRMKGGVNDDVTITAYITASFLELGITVEDPVVNKGLLCLKSSIGNITNTYTNALLAYTFSLAGEGETRELLLKELDSVAIAGDGRLHWTQSALDDFGTLSVEISSYVLLAVLSTGQLTAAELGYSNRIVSWLVKQQNPYGGFSSTQDTVVALQALALYSTKVFSSDGSSTVTVTSADGDSHNFDVNQNNKLLYQEKSLRDVSGKYSINVNGSTCVSVQTALFYNVPTPNITSTLSITATAEGNCTKPFGHILALNFTVTYNGELNSTNMIIVDIKLLSGFTADPGELKKGILVERVDSTEDHLIMYIKELRRNIPIHYVLHIKQVLPVKNLKPAQIEIYDYYHTSDQSETEYTSPCV
ncbi:alpha-2-macroglobulin-like [Silurus meridionalis]|nr:alpha-2-macroglobulin-like [Silurus meridionalis]